MEKFVIEDPLSALPKYPAGDPSRATFHLLDPNPVLKKKKGITKAKQTRTEKTAAAKPTQSSATPAREKFLAPSKPERRIHNLAATTDPEAPITELETKMCFDYGWKVNSVGVGGRTKCRIYTLECIRGHICLSRRPEDKCIICKLLYNTKDKCPQKLYLTGRQTFEFICARGHHYYHTYSVQKPTPKCRGCEIEDTIAAHGVQITIDRGVYSDPTSRLHFTCKCGDTGYLNEKMIKKMTTGVPLGEKIGGVWCHNHHHTGVRADIVRTVAAFSYLFECHFDDDDLMQSLDANVPRGARFTGYNRERGIAFVSRKDPSRTNDDLTPEYLWCGRKGITMAVLRDVGAAPVALAAEICAALKNVDRFPSGKTESEMIEVMSMWL